MKKRGVVAVLVRHFSLKMVLDSKSGQVDGEVTKMRQYAKSKFDAKPAGRRIPQ